MGGFEDIDEAILAGERIENEDIGTSAAIGVNKIAKRTIYINVPIPACVLSGAGTSLTKSAAFPAIVLPNANSAAVYFTVSAPRGEVVPGERAKLRIFWIKNTAVSGNIRLVVNITPAITGSTSVASAIERSVISVALSGTTDIQEASIDLPPAVFSNNQIIGLQISRDPTNTLDTLDADISIVGACIEIQGRC